MPAHWARCCNLLLLTRNWPFCDLGVRRIYDIVEHVLLVVALFVVVIVVVGCGIVVPGVLGAFVVHSVMYV